MMAARNGPSDAIITQVAASGSQKRRIERWECLAKAGLRRLDAEKVGKLHEEAVLTKFLFIER